MESPDLFDPSQCHKSNKYVLQCLFLSFTWPTDWSGWAEPDLPSTWTLGHGGVYSVAVYSVAVNNHDPTIHFMRSTSRQKGAVYKELYSYWPFYECSPLHHSEVTAHTGTNIYEKSIMWSNYIVIIFKCVFYGCVLLEVNNVLILFITFRYFDQIQQFANNAYIRHKHL